MAQQFKVGDIVQLKSGSPKMTVENVVDDDTVWCVWFAGAKREDTSFSVETLILAPPEKPKE